MSTKIARTLVATIAILGLAGMAAPADASPTKPQTRNVWCC